MLPDNKISSPCLSFSLSVCLSLSVYSYLPQPTPFFLFSLTHTFYKMLFIFITCAHSDFFQLLYFILKSKQIWPIDLISHLITWSLWIIILKTIGTDYFYFKCKHFYMWRMNYSHYISKRTCLPCLRWFHEVFSFYSGRGYGEGDPYTWITLTKWITAVIWIQRDTMFQIKLLSDLNISIGDCELLCNGG